MSWKSWKPEYSPFSLSVALSGGAGDILSGPACVLIRVIRRNLKYKKCLYFYWELQEDCPVHVQGWCEWGCDLYCWALWLIPPVLCCPVRGVWWCSSLWSPPDPDLPRQAGLDTAANQGEKIQPTHDLTALPTSIYMWGYHYFDQKLSSTQYST